MKPMKAFVRQCDVFVPAPAPGTGVVAATFYSSLQGDLVSIHTLISRSDTADEGYLRRSTDHGRTWSDPVPWPTKFEAPGGTGRRHPRGGYCDALTGRYLTVWTEGVLPTDHPLEGMRRWQLCYSVSEDGGLTTSVNEPIIEDAPGFDAEHPLPGVTVGKNCVMMGDMTCRPLGLPDGTMLVPVQSSPAGPDGEYWNPTGAFSYTDALVLRGRWKPDGRISWHASARVKADPARSTRGLIEPTLGQLEDGRILMVMRGSNHGRAELPAYKWFALSRDDGRTWSEPEPWTYDDGQAFFSPSACSQLIPHSSGRLLWMGNISPGNPVSNAPRYPLVLAEVDRRTGLLRRDTVTVIDDRKPGESKTLTLSNFCVREDLETGDLLLHMTRFFASPARARKQDWEADALIYRIGID